MMSHDDRRLDSHRQIGEGKPQSPSTPLTDHENSQAVVTSAWAEHIEAARLAPLPRASLLSWPTVYGGGGPFFIAPRTLQRAPLCRVTARRVRVKPRLSGLMRQGAQLSLENQQRGAGWGHPAG
jgi:hypothetical protein